MRVTGLPSAMGAMALVRAMASRTALPTGTLVSVPAVAVELSLAVAAVVLEQLQSVAAEAVEAPLPLALGVVVAMVVVAAEPSAVAGAAAKVTWVAWRQLLGTTSTARRRVAGCRRRALRAAAVGVAVERRRPAPCPARVRLQERMPPCSRG